MKLPFKSQVLPLTNAERIANSLSAFHQAKNDLVAVVSDVEDQISEKQDELKQLNAEHTQATDALKRITAITG